MVWYTTTCLVVNISSYMTYTTKLLLWTINTFWIACQCNISRDRINYYCLYGNSRDPRITSLKFMICRSAYSSQAWMGSQLRSMLYLRILSHQTAHVISHRGDPWATNTEVEPQHNDLIMRFLLLKWFRADLHMCKTSNGNRVLSICFLFNTMV